MAVIIDWNGLNGSIVAIGGILTILANFIIAIYTLRQSVVIKQAQGALQVSAVKTDEKITEVHNLVNSQSEKLNAAIAAQNLAKGIAQGTLQERANPMVPKADIERKA